MLDINSRKQLAVATAVMQERINERLMDEGVTMLSPSQVWVGPQVSVGRDTELLPGTMLWGTTTVGEDCVIGPNVCVTDATIPNGTTLANATDQDLCKSSR